MTKIEVNGLLRDITAPAEKALLWVLREDCQLTGTKFSCGVGVCGACTVHLAGQAIRSCITPLAAVNGPVRTVEDLENSDGELHPVQVAWLAETVSQCGYCQPGQIMAAVAFLAANPEPTPVTIAAAMTNLCRCGTYPRIQKAILRAAASLRAQKTTR